MMKKMLDFIKKYRLMIISAVIVLVIGITAIFMSSLLTKSISIKTIDEKYYAFKHDSTWKLIEKEKNKIILNHSSGSKIEIIIKELSGEYRYLSIEDLIDDLIHSIQKQNTNYNLISNKKDYLTKDNYEGYKLLYENDQEQVMISAYKKGDKLIIVKYEADNKYFDILLDSVHNIIYNLNVKEETIDLKSSLNLELSDIKYADNKEFDNLLSNSKTYEIANEHYFVEYSLPDKFSLQSINSSNGYFQLMKNESRYDKVMLNVTIVHRNIYEYVDRNSDHNVYQNYSFYKKTDGDYSGFSESLSKLECEKECYLYKNNYYYDKAVKYDENFDKHEYKQLNETAELIFALDSNHIILFKMEAENEIPLTKKLIDNIKIISSKNYANYISVEKEGNNIVGRLRKFTDYKNEIISEIKILLPDKYVEVDNNSMIAQNIYEERYYGLNYHEDMDIYDYDVYYQRNINAYRNLNNSGVETTIKLENSLMEKNYGKYKELTLSGNITLNGKEFIVYSGGYTDKSGILLSNRNRKLYYVNEKVLLYKMAGEYDDEYLEIRVRGNDKEITDEVLKEITNFTISEMDV